MQIKNVAIFFYLGLGLLLALLLAQAKVQKDLLDSAESAETGQRKIEVLDRLLISMLNIETGVRGFLITRDSQFLTPYYASLKELDEQLKRTRELFADDSQHRDQISELYHLINRRTLVSQQAIHLPPDATKATDKLIEGKVHMDQIRRLILQIAKDRKKENQLKREENIRFTNRMIWVTILTSLGVFVFMYTASREVQREILRRTKSEHELKISMSFMHNLTSALPTGVIAVDRLGKITFANHRSGELLGLNPDRMIGQFFSSLSGANAEDRRKLEHALLGGMDIEFESVLGHHRRFSAALKFAPLHQRSERVGGLVSFQDNSREIETRAELSAKKDSAESASHAKSAFLSQLSHELRTPLNAIIGMGEMLHETAVGPEQRKFTAVLNSAAQNLLRLINDVLDISKIEAGKLELEELPFDMYSLLDDCIKIMSYKASEKGLVLELNNQCSHSVFIGDAMRLRQVLINLLGNAIKFTERGSIFVDAYHEGDEVIIAVRDTGKGIAPERLQHIFEHYAQEDKKIARDYGGTGLGLSISRDIARLMEGDISVTSTPGLGSTFTLRVKLKLGDDQSLKTHAGQSVVLRPMRLLLVDDNSDNRLVVTSYLKEQPVHVDEVVDGEEAVKIASKNQYDLILMDMHMPQMDGYEATAKLRELGVTTPIVALTAYALKNEIDRIMAAGCQDRLSKPITRFQLLNYLESFQSRYMTPENDPMGALIPQYLARRAADIPNLKHWVEQQDKNALRTFCHNLKGTALSYEQAELDAWVHEFSEALKQTDWSRMQAMIPGYERLVTS